MAWTAVGLGSNVGDRRSHLRAAVACLADHGSVLAVSALFATAPVGGPDQGPFLNAVAVVDTDLEPRPFLDALLSIERRLGRVRSERWGPRTIDLDLLIYDDRQIEEPGLTVPHPRLVERRFVLYPLLTVWPRPELPDGTGLAAAAEAVRHQDVTAITGGYDPEAGDWWE